MNENRNEELDNIEKLINIIDPKNEVFEKTKERIAQKKTLTSYTDETHKNSEKEEK